MTPITAWKLSDGHPRVLVRPGDLPTLRRRAQTTHQREMSELVQLAEAVSKEPPEPQASIGPTLRLAFLYLLSSDRAHAELAARCVEQTLKLDVSGEYGVGSARLKAVACAYDWLHAVLPDDLRIRCGRRALEQAQALYNSEEIEPESFLAGHGVNQIPYTLMAGLAVGDDFGGDGLACARPMPIGREPHHARDYINDALYRTERMFACYRHFMEGASFSQSYAYSLAYIGEIPYIFQLAETGLGLPFFQEHAWFANAAPWYTYALRSDESFIRFGDYFCRDSIFKGAYMYRAMAAIASRYGDGVARWWANRFKVSGCEPDAFVFDDREGREAKLEALPRTRHFVPMGISIARGDFADGTLAAFKCSPVYLHNHCHRDQNSLTVYHKGELAIDAGAYDGYESPHWKNYYIRTIAHNTLVVHDPGEQMLMRSWPLANDGGQRFVNVPHFAPKRFEDIRKECFQDGRTLAYREGGGFSYVCGDASNCYRKEKLTRFLRHVVFVLDWPHKSAVSMVVLDEVEVARNGLAPRILLHTVEEPERKDSCVTARFGGGRLNMHVLLPQAAAIEAIGGPGKECWVDGKNFPVDLDADENLRRAPAWHKPGEWRVEISPKDNSSRKTVFLTHWVASDADAPQAPAVTLETDSSGWIVRQGDLAVGLFRPGQPGKLSGKRTIAVELASE